MITLLLMIINHQMRGLCKEGGSETRRKRRKRQGCGEFTTGAEAEEILYLGCVKCLQF